MQMNFYPISLIKFAISNSSESKKFISTIRPERIFLSLTRVLEGGDLEGSDEADASLALLPFLFSSLLVTLWHWERRIFGAIKLKVGREGDEKEIFGLRRRWEEGFWFEI